MKKKKISKKLRKYCEDIRLPDRERVLPDGAAASKKSHGGRMRVRAASLAAACLLLAAGISLPFIMKGDPGAISDNRLTGQQKIFPEAGQSVADKHEISPGDGQTAADIWQVSPDEEMTVSYLIPTEGKSYKMAGERWDKDTQITPTIIANNFFDLCGLTNIKASGDNIKVIQPPDETKNGTITHYAAIRTLTLTLEGSLPDELTLKCLVNTLAENFSLRYTVLILDGGRVSIGGLAPEEGFARFELSYSAPSTYGGPAYYYGEYSSSAYDPSYNPAPSPQTSPPPAYLPGETMVSEASPPLPAKP